jgi:hypothetical protein
MLQTMMQTVCQLVNNELISNKKCNSNCTSQQQSTANLSRVRRDQTDFQISEPRQNWISNPQVQRQTLLSKTNSVDELYTYTPRMSNRQFRSRLFQIIFFI